jgi:hypothetical protein
MSGMPNNHLASTERTSRCLKSRAADAPLYGGIIMVSSQVFRSQPDQLSVLRRSDLRQGHGIFFYKKDLTPEMSPLTNNDALVLGALAGSGALFGNILAAIFLFVGTSQAGSVQDPGGYSRHEDPRSDADTGTDGKG